MRAAALAALLLLSACAQARFAMREPRRAARVRRVAVLPFFDANRLSAEKDFAGTPRRDGARWTRRFAAMASKKLAGRIDFVHGPPVTRALVETSGYKRYLEDDGSSGRTGFTVAEARRAGKALGADAVLLGAVAVADEERLQEDFRRAVSVRLVDVPSGRVIWAASAVERLRIQFEPVRQIVRKLDEELR